MAGPFPSANSVTRHAPTRGLFDAGDWPETPTAIAEPTSKVINTSRSVAHRVACLIEVSLSQSNRHDRRAGLHGPPGASSRPYVTYLRGPPPSQSLPSRRLHLPPATIPSCPRRLRYRCPRIGTPPPSASTSAMSRCASRVGSPRVRFWNSFVVMRNMRAV